MTDERKVEWGEKRRKVQYKGNKKRQRITGWWKEKEKDKEIERKMIEEDKKESAEKNGRMCKEGRKMK